MPCHNHTFCVAGVVYKAFFWSQAANTREHQQTPAVVLKLNLFWSQLWSDSSWIIERDSPRNTNSLNTTVPHTEEHSCLCIAFFYCGVEVCLHAPGRAERWMCPTMHQGNREGRAHEEEKGFFSLDNQNHASSIIILITQWSILFPVHENLTVFNAQPSYLLRNFVS